MTPNLDTLMSDALALPPELRMVMAHRLWESVEIDDDEELFAEIDRRLAEIDAGKAKFTPYEEAMKKIRDSLK